LFVAVAIFPAAPQRTRLGGEAFMDSGELGIGERKPTKAAAAAHLMKIGAWALNYQGSF